MNSQSLLNGRFGFTRRMQNLRGFHSPKMVQNEMIHVFYAKEFLVDLKALISGYRTESLAFLQPSMRITQFLYILGFLEL